MNSFDNENEFLDSQDVEYDEVTEEASEEIPEELKNDTLIDEILTKKEEEPKKKGRFSFKKVVALTLIVSMIGGLSIGAGISITNSYLGNGSQAFHFGTNSFAAADSKEKKQLIKNYNGQMEDSPIVKIAQDVGPSIVAITSKVKVSDWFNNNYTQEAQGSGVIFDINADNILIMTNNHVINGAEELAVTLGEDISVPAQVVGEDKDTDLAIIKIDKKDVPQEAYKQIKPAVFGDSDSLKPGEPAIAIGNPLGYNKTVTVGVISALNRDLKLPDEKLRLLQTDAAINPGNSGGALVNIKGEVIGINTIKIADTKVEGIGFAIPINFAKPIVKELVNKGYVSRPYLGIMGRDVDEKASNLYEIPIGVVVVDVLENSAAARSGIQKGDVIIGLDGTKIISMDQLSNLIKDYEPGTKVKITIVRNGKEKKELTAKLGEKK